MIVIIITIPKSKYYIVYILYGLESDWLRRSIWGGIFLCSSHSNPTNFFLELSKNK
jgi:hypothetical protein